MKTSRPIPPPAPPPVQYQYRPVQIEKTAKKWKSLQAQGAGIGVLCFILAVIVKNSNPEGTDVTDYPAMALTITAFTGFVVWLYAKLMGWWHHG